MGTDSLLTWYQALQIPGLTMCVLTLVFLFVMDRPPSLFIVPAIYFLAVTASFFIPLINQFEISSEMHGALILAETMISAMSFLLIIQLTTGRVPTWIYWLVLAVPLIGGRSIVYSTIITQEELCVQQHFCGSPLVIKELYDIFSSALIFLLTIFVRRRIDPVTEIALRQHKHRFMLVMALVILNLVILVITIGELNRFWSEYQGALALTVVRTGFMYMVSTSIFRVFDGSFKIAAIGTEVPTVGVAAPAKKKGWWTGKWKANTAKNRPFHA